MENLYHDLFVVSFNSPVNNEVLSSRSVNSCNVLGQVSSLLCHLEWNNFEIILLCKGTVAQTGGALVSHKSV